MAIALCALLLYYLSGSNRFEYADALYLPVLLKDIFSQGGAFADWYLTPAPYFFPDYAIFLMAYFLGKSIYWQIILFTIFQCLALFWALYYLACQIDKSISVVYSAFTTTGLIWLAIAVDQPFIFLLSSAHHYGAFLSTVIMLGLWLQYLACTNTKTSIVTLILASILAFLSALSDNLFIVQSLLPLLLVCIVYHVRNCGWTFKKFPSAIAFPVVFGIIGSISYPLMVTHQTRYLGLFGVSQTPQNLKDLLAIAIQIASKSVVLDVAIILFIIFLIYLAISWHKNKPIDLLKGRLLWVAFFSGCSMSVTLFSVALIKNVPVTERYLISFYAWPIIVVGLFFASYYRPKTLNVMVLASLMLSISLLTGSIAQSKRLGITWDNYSEDQDCIDRALTGKSLENGISQYWDAKSVQALSHLNLRLAQHFEDLSEHRWITSSRYFQPAYDFVIISEDAKSPYKISREKVIAINGLPKQEYACGNRSVLVYGKNQVRVK